MTDDLISRQLKLVNELRERGDPSYKAALAKLREVQEAVLATSDLGQAESMSKAFRKAQVKIVVFVKPSIKSREHEQQQGLLYRACTLIDGAIESLDDPLDDAEVKALILGYRDAEGGEHVRIAKAHQPLLDWWDRRKGRRGGG